MVVRTSFALLSDTDTPLSMFYKISQTEPMAFLLESNEEDTRLARFSFMGIAPVKTVSFKDGIVTVTHCDENRVETLVVENPLAFLQGFMDQYGHMANPALAAAEGFPFTGGLVGYTGYGATRYFERIPQQADDPMGVPEGYYGLYDSIILFDHLYQKMYFLSHRNEAEARPLWDTIIKRLQSAAPLPPIVSELLEIPEESIFEDISGPFTKESFCDMVLKAKEYIREGQIFQVVVSQRFSQPVTTEPINVYRMIRTVNPSPYSYFLKFPEFTYLGASPETFVRCVNGEVSLRVLAGTRPRGETEEADQKLVEELVHDEKELAEHYMLVDLGRNDLGRICRVGSIQVGQIATITRYTHVMHLATKITGKLRGDKTAFNVFQSCFPRGTVSGAPKIRALQLLAELEPEQRGIYSGAVGYFDYYGNMDSAIAIRSVLMKDGWAHVNAGAGVVHDSNPQGEYKETRNKAKSILKAIKLAERVAGHDCCAY